MRGIQVTLLLWGLALPCAADSALQGGAMAFVTTDPRGFGANSAWVGPLLRVLDGAGVVRAEDRGVADAVLAMTLLGTYPSTVALLDLKAARYEPRKLLIDELAAVVSVEVSGPAGLVECRQTLQTILSHYGENGDREQTALQLPGDRRGVRYRLRNWPGWMAVEWAVDGQRFVVGVGEGSLKRWFDAGADVAGEDVPGAASRHEAAMRELPAGDAALPRMLAAYADVAALRASAPTLFRTGRLTPTLSVLGLDDADSVMLQARWRDTLLATAGSVTRGDATTTRVLSLDHWPDDAALQLPPAPGISPGPPPGRFHMAIPMDVPAVARAVVELIGISKEDDDRAAYRRWVDTQYGDAPDRPGLTAPLRHYRPMLLVSDYPKAWLPVPGTATVYFTLTDDASLDAARDDLDTLLAPALHRPGDAPDAVAVVSDPATGVAWLDSPMRGLFKAPAWGWAGRTLIMSYSPVAVLQNRTWMQERENRESAEARNEP